MIKKIYAKLVIVFCLFIPYIAIGNTLTFEDFTRQVNGTNYHGFIFGDRWWKVSDIGNPLSFDNDPATSSMIKRIDNGTFIFEGASFWSRANDKNVTTTIQMYNGNSLVSTMEFRLDKNSHPFIVSEYNHPISYMTVSVDNRTIQGFDRNYLAMDDFTTAVDEPHPMALLTAGMLVVGFMSRRKNLQDRQCML